MDEIPVSGFLRVFSEAEFLICTAGIAHVELATGMKCFGKAGASGVFEIVSMVAKIIADCRQTAPTIRSLAGAYCRLECRDIGRVHLSFCRATEVGGAIALLALFEFESAACLKQFDEIASAMATRIKIAVIGPKIQGDAGDERPAILVSDIGVGAQQ